MRTVRWHLRFGGCDCRRRASCIEGRGAGLAGALIDSLHGARIASARAAVRVAIAPIMAEPGVSSGQTSQLLRGHQADVLESDGKWLRLRGADGYEGWCHEGYVTVSHALGGPPLTPGWSSERRMSLGCVVSSPASGEIELPLGALLDPDEEIVRGVAMNSRARARYFESDTDLVVRRTVELFRGTPYQWGGVTPWGADCSGLVQTMFALHGTQLPRDAWMQAERGREVEHDVTDLEPGDLLFFSDRDDGRPTHVALSLGSDRCVHSSLANGGFGINSLDATDPVARGLRDSFRFARRIL